MEKKIEKSGKTASWTEIISLYLLPEFCGKQRNLSLCTRKKKTNIPLSPESFFGDVSVKFLHIKYTRKYKAHKDQCNETTAIISILNGLPFPYMRQQCDGSVFPSTYIEIQIVIDANILSEYTSISSIYSALLQSDSFLFCCGARSGYLLPLQILSIFTWPMPTAWSTPLFLFYALPWHFPCLFLHFTSCRH